MSRFRSACFLLALVLSACTSSQLNVAPSTSLPLPEATDMLLPTATSTPQPMPEYMNAYLEGGYDQRSTANYLCFVIHENNVHYSALEGIVYRERVIRSWLEVEYVQDGVLKQGIILEFVRRGGEGIHQDFTKIIWSGSGSSFVNPSVAFVQTMHNGWAEYTPTEHSIACGLLGLVPTPAMALVPGVDLLFEGVFPVVDGVAQAVTIPGIGEVLPITQCFVIEE